MTSAAAWLWRHFTTIVACAAMYATLALLVGCSGNGGEITGPGTLPPGAGAGFVCWSKDLAWSAPLWRDEARRRLPNAIVFVAHGAAMTREGAGELPRWKITADPDLLAKFLQQCFPGRPIAMVSCNPTGEQLHVARVWYPRANVWHPPDPQGLLGRKSPDGDDVVGSIDEFEEGFP